jgi:hypothetical protein
MTFYEANDYYDTAEKDEKIFLDELLASVTENHSLTETNLYNILDEQPLVPGLIYPNSSLFYSNLIKHFFGERHKFDFSLSNCSLSTICQQKFIQSIQMARDIQIIYPIKYFSGDFHSKRPDLYLGQLKRNFAETTVQLKDIDQPVGGFKFFCFADKIKDLNKSLISGLLSSYFMPLSTYHGSSETTNCINTSTKILKQFHKTFVEIVKHSVFKNSLSEMENKMEYQSKYGESLQNEFYVNNLEVPEHLYKQLETICFCCKTVKTKDLLNDEDKSITCDYFKPTLTSKGPCFTSNALSMQEIYKKTKHLDNWNDAFDKTKSSIFKNDASGPENGFNFVLNSFDKYLEASKSQSFLFSISNEYESDIMFKKSYTIMPGFRYTFRVMAKQIVSSEALNNVSPMDRNCLLKNENGHLNFSNFYTKSTCEYECVAYQAVEACGCAPWYIPFFEDKPYCDVQTHCGFYSEYVYGTICDLRENCFENYLNNASTDQCKCPTDCEEMDYSIIKSNQPLHLPQNFCTDDNLKIQYPFSVYCEICHKIIQFHKIRLVYDHYTSDKANPDDINAFCQYFISNYTALVKIEMVSKSVMRSIRDKRFSLLAQVSELGKNFHVSMNPMVNLINLFE